jgi:hypothetical protein
VCELAKIHVVTSGKILLVNEISVEETAKTVVSSEAYLSTHGLLRLCKVTSKNG